MKLTIDAKVLAAAAADAAKALPRNAHLPVLNCLRVCTENEHSISLAGFDYDTSIVVSAAAVVSEGGNADLLPGRALAQFAARLKGDVTLEVDGGTATLSAGRTKITLHTLPAADYPALPEPLPAVLTVDGAALAAAVAAVAHAISTDNTLHALEGVHLTASAEGITLSATNRYVMAHVKVDVDWTGGDTEVKALLPGRMFVDLTKRLTGPVGIGVDESSTTLATAERTVTMRHIAAEFPAIRTFLAIEPTTTVQLDRAALLDALDLAHTAAEGRDLPVRLTVGTDTVDYRVGDDTQQLLGTLDAVIAGPELDGPIGFNAAYLAGLVRAVDGADITLGLIAPRRPLIVHVDNAVHLLQPISLNA